MTKVAVLTNSPAPYRDQLLAGLRERYGAVDVAYTHPASDDRGWRIEPVPSRSRLRPIVYIERLGYLNRNVIRLVRHNDVIIVGGYEQPSYMLAIVVARLFRRRLVILFDGIAPSRLVAPRKWQTRLKSLLVRRAHVCLANGDIGRRYFRDVLRVRPERIHNQYLVPLDLRSRCADVPSDEPFDVLFVGRLMERKGVAILIDALHRIPHVRARIVGTGPLEPDLRRNAAELDVTFTGELDAAGVAAAMRSARCLVVPSVDEPWGLVVHEALQFDLPVVVSSDLGCTADLIVDGVNGVVCPVLDATHLAAAIEQCLALDPTSVAAADREILATWDLAHHVAAFVDAIEGVDATSGGR